MAALALLLLLAPGEKVHWSEAHGVGVMLPGTWTIVARDDGDRAFVVDGPQLGPGVPRAVLWAAGSASSGTLQETADKLAAQAGKREGWSVTTKVRKTVGPFPAVRIALAFQQPGKAKGRARFTVALLGGRYFVLELSAAASHFPGRTFDRIEQSLQVRWKETAFENGLVLETPPGWEVDGGAEGGAVAGPRRGGQPTMVLWKREPEASPAPPDARSGDAVRFLKERRDTLVAERAFPEGPQRMLLFNAEGWTLAIRMPADAWEDLFPVAKEIVERARLAAGR